MTVCGIGEGPQREVFHLLASILHLGNLAITDKEVRGADNQAVINDNPTLRHAAELLQVTASDLVTALTTRTIKTVGETVQTTLTAAQAAFARDSLAMGIYSRLFQWIVSQINETIFDEDPATVIGVLDIYGFEIFEHNSFEQLCINFVNEKLQQIFIELTLRKEQEEYVAEGARTFVERCLDHSCDCRCGHNRHLLDANRVLRQQACLRSDRAPRWSL